MYNVNVNIMKMRSILCLVLLYGLITEGIAQNMTTNPDLEKIMKNLDMEYKYDNESQGYIAEYCRLSSCTVFCIQYKTLNQQGFVAFTSLIGTLTGINQEVYQKLNDLNTVIGLGTLVISEDGVIYWIYTIPGIDKDSMAYYLDYVNSTESSVYDELEDHLE